MFAMREEVAASSSRTMSEPDSDREALLELLKMAQSEGRELLPNYIRAVAIYTAITGGLLKFAFDVNATPVLRIMLARFGIVISCIALLMCFWGDRMRRRVRLDVDYYSALLLVRPPRSASMPLHYLARSAALLSLVVLAGWLYVLLKF